MKLECNDLVNHIQLNFFLSADKTELSTKGLDTIGNRGLNRSQGDGHKARRRLLTIIGELLALMLRATANQPVCGGNKALKRPKKRQ